MTEELKPCPFCGGKAYTVRDYISTDDVVAYEDFYVAHWCSLMPQRIVTRKFLTEEQAIAAWNRRADHD